MKQQLRIVFKALIAVVLFGCSEEKPLEVSHDLALAGNETSYEFEIGFVQVFPNRTLSYALVLAIPIKENLDWYEKCVNSIGSPCKMPGRYHVTISEAKTGRRISDFEGTPFHSDRNVSLQHGEVFEATLVRTELAAARYTIQVKNIEDVNALNHTRGKLWLERAMK